MARINCISWEEVVLGRLTEITEIWSQRELRLLNCKLTRLRKRYNFLQDLRWLDSYYPLKCDVIDTNFLNWRNIEEKLWKFCLLLSVRKWKLSPASDWQQVWRGRWGSRNRNPSKSWPVLFIFPRSQENNPGEPSINLSVLSVTEESCECKAAGRW